MVFVFFLKKIENGQFASVGSDMDIFRESWTALVKKTLEICQINPVFW